MCELTKTERSHLLEAYRTSSSGAVEIRSDAKKRSKKKRSSLSVIIFGQVVAFALACGNASSSALENQYKIHAPTCLTGIVYFVLSFHVVWLWKQRTKQETKIQTRHYLPFTNLNLLTPWYIYFMLSVLDVEANYLAMLSFQQTKLSSSMLLTSLSVLSTVFLRRIIFGSIINSRRKLIGVTMCIIGGCLCLQGDVHGNEISTSRDLSHDSRVSYLQGDLLALVAAFLYGLNDVLAEYFVKNNDRIEFLGMLGLFGSVFSFFVQAPLLEREEVRKLVTKFSLNWSDVESNLDLVLLLLFCFVGMLSFFYIAVSIFLSENDATILNLSLQTCTLWTVVLATIADFVKSGEVNWFPSSTFFSALILVIVGTFTYEGEDEDNHTDDSFEIAKTSAVGCDQYRIDEFIP